MAIKKSFTGSIERLEKSKRYLSGGVSSGLRSASKPVPLFFSSGAGPRLRDVDGNDYIDYTLAWGPLILGHCSPVINEAVTRQLNTLQQVGAQHDLEWQVAEQICRMVPGVERVLFSNSGTEAVQTAFRLARAYTGRKKIIRFEGHYHGWMDNVLPGYRPPINTEGVPSPVSLTEGMAEFASSEVIILPWNDLAILESTLRQRGHEIAALITEGILCNSGCLLPLPGFLQGLRELTSRFGVVFILDEVITGFRVAPGGAQSYYGIRPDLSTFGKAIAGGFVLSAIGGRADILRLVEERRVVHAGTFNGNPISLAAAQAVLQTLAYDSGAVLKGIQTNGELLMQGIRSMAQQWNVPILANGVGSVFHLFFTKRTEMHSYRDTVQANQAARDWFLEAMLEEGIYLLPDGRWYVSSAHSRDDIELTLSRVDAVFSRFPDAFRSSPSRAYAPGLALKTSLD